MRVKANLSVGLSSLVTSHTTPSINTRRRLSRMAGMVLNSARVIQHEGFPGYRYKCAFITLTYAPKIGYHQGDIEALLQCYYIWCRRHLKKLGLPPDYFRLVWVMELHQSGLPHYHIALFLPYLKGKNGFSLTPPMPDKQAWWKHGHTNVQWAYNPVGYLAKYLSKGDDVHPFPKGARTYGFRNLSETGNAVRRHYRQPRWLRTYLQRDTHTDTAVACRRKFGYWYSPDTGKSYRSPYCYDVPSHSVFECRPNASDILPFDIEHIYDCLEDYPDIEHDIFNRWAVKVF